MNELHKHPWNLPIPTSHPNQRLDPHKVEEQFSLLQRGTVRYHPNGLTLSHLGPSLHLFISGAIMGLGLSLTIHAPGPIDQRVLVGVVITPSIYTSPQSPLSALFPFSPILLHSHTIKYQCQGSAFYTLLLSEHFPGPFNCNDTTIQGLGCYNMHLYMYGVNISQFLIDHMLFLSGGFFNNQVLNSHSNG